MQLLEQLSIALLSHPVVFLQCYSLLLLYFGQINDDDDDDDDDDLYQVTERLRYGFHF